MLVWLPGAAAANDDDDVCDDEDVTFFASIIATRPSSPTPAHKNTPQTILSSGSKPSA